MKTKNFTRFLMWESMIILGLLVIIGCGILVGTNYGVRATQQAVVPSQPDITSTATPVATPTPSPVPTVHRASAVTSAGGIVPIASIGNNRNTIGWVDASLTESDLGQSYLYLMLRDGTVYHGPMQFDLSFVPTGSTVIMAEVAGEEPETGNSFILNILNTNAPAANLSSQVVFKVGEQAVVQDKLEEASLLSFNLKDLFPAGIVDSAGGMGVSAQELNLSSSDPVTEPGEGTPTATFVVITSTPIPENIVTVAAVAATATYQATTIGTPTPLPPNWVTPWVVTSTPTPANAATAEFRQVEATYAAKLYGTAPPPPPHMVTATPKPTATPQPTETPTPIFILLDGELPPTTPEPWATLEPVPPIPAQLIGKIAFKSDRTGREEIYIINPDGSGLALLTNRWPYNMAKLADSFSADGRFRVFTKDAVRYSNTGYLTFGNGKKEEIPALYWYDSLYKVEEQLTHFGTGIAYQGVWSPAGEQIAFVSNDSADDEIWVVNRDGSSRLQLTSSNEAFNAREIGKDTFVPEVNRHPSWSPDGKQLVYWSNPTGIRQIWVMDPDGSNAYSLSRTGFNDWDPVWIKYPGIPGDALSVHIPYAGPYNPAGEDRNCQDFISVGEAQAFYLAAGGPYRDLHKLDRNNDGIACN